jgi:hypothetical protein
MDLGLAVRKTKVPELSANMENVHSSCAGYVPNITTLFTAVDFFK